MGTSDLQSLKDAATLPPIPVLPRFELRRDGLYFIDGKIDPDSGKVHERPPLWLCDPLELIGTGVDASRVFETNCGHANNPFHGQVRARRSVVETVPRGLATGPSSHDRRDFIKNGR